MLARSFLVFLLVPVFVVPGSSAAADEPASRGTGIRPPALGQEPVVKPLPGTITDVCVGGGGRYLILYVSQVRKLAVFDVNTAQVVKYLPVAEDGIRFAAGLDKLVVVLPNAKVIQRWSLVTFEREVAVPLPIQYQLTGIALGSASDGPLLVESADYPRIGELFFFDIRTMKKLDTTIGKRVHTNIGPQYRLRASADGSVFTGGNQSYVLNGSVLDCYQPESQGDVLPAPDGRTLYSPGRRFTADGRLLGEPVGGHGQMTWYLPALHGPYYLSLNETREGGRGPQFLSLRLHLAGESRPLVAFPKLPALEGLVDWASGRPQPFEQHVFLIPDAKLLAVIPSTKDRLVLHHYDIDQMLEKAGIDYLFATSKPPTQFQPGTTWSYQLAIRSKKGGVKYSLDVGPPGMTVSPSGFLRWAVPGNFDRAEVDVVLTIGDASEQEMFHLFKLTNGKHSAPAKVAGTPVIQAPVAPPTAPMPAAPQGPALARAPANPLPIKPAPLKDEKATVALPSAIRDVCAAGGGRFLILHLPQSRHLAVFDVNEARIVKYLAQTDDKVVFAAGMDKLLVILPDKRVIQRWSLTTFERELAIPLTIPGQISAAVMGCASDGPLVLTGPGMRGEGGLPLRFVDVKTLNEITGLKRQGGGNVGTHPQYPAALRISADGRVLGMWTPGLSPAGLQAVVLGGEKIQTSYEHTTVGSILPGPDGRVLFTNGGLYTVDLKRIEAGKGGVPVPAVHGHYYLTVNNPGAKPLTTVHLAGDHRPLVTLPELDGLAGGSPLPLEKRLFLIPLARLIVTIPVTGDKLHLQRFDLDQALEKADIDYLLVTSQPQTVAIKGQTYTYPLAVKSKKGGVKYKLESGPDGMKLGPDGKLTWPVPAHLTEAEVDVIVTVSDASGQEIFHTFKIIVQDKGVAAPASPQP
jgi:hypothetical protein